MPITHDPDVPHEWEQIGDIFVTRTGTGEIPAPHWQGFIDALVAAGVTTLIAFVVGDASINAMQRKRAADLFREQGITTTVVTQDAVTRGVVTALSWLGASIKAVSWKDLDKALARVEVEGEDKQRLQEIAMRCLDEVGG